MALLAEELVEEWLNRQAYFTIRGLKIGVDEIDLLAIKFLENGSPEYRHIEVQASMRPIGYIAPIPKNYRANGQSGTSAKARDNETKEAAVKEWVAKKFTKPKKTNVIQSLCPEQWQSEFVVNNVRSKSELELIEAQGVKIIRLPTIIKELNENSFQIKSASGADFADLIQLASQNV